MDVDEWGQVVIINMLTRYARTQFTDPNLEVSAYLPVSNKLLNLSHFSLSCLSLQDGDDENEENSQDDDENLSDSDDGKQFKGKRKSTEKNKKTYTLDPDHRLLLRNARPLLQSRNASVCIPNKTFFDLYYLIVGTESSKFNLIFIPGGNGSGSNVPSSCTAL